MGRILVTDGERFGSTSKNESLTLVLRHIDNKQLHSQEEPQILDEVTIPQIGGSFIFHVQTSFQGNHNSGSRLPSPPSLHTDDTHDDDSIKKCHILLLELQSTQEKSAVSGDSVAIVLPTRDDFPSDTLTLEIGLIRLRHPSIFMQDPNRPCSSQSLFLLSQSLFLIFLMILLGVFIRIKGRQRQAMKREKLQGRGTSRNILNICESLHSIQTQTGEVYTGKQEKKVGDKQHHQRMMRQRMNLLSEKQFLFIRSANNM